MEKESESGALLGVELIPLAAKSDYFTVKSAGRFSFS